ncbi:MAG: hypothetical protein IJD33_05510, partial [Clostridia bacterium]|nr:hypothetical protein [Clostridia bacterium]
MKKKLFQLRKKVGILFAATLLCMVGCSDSTSSNSSNGKGENAGTTIEVTEEYTLVDFKNSASESNITVEDKREGVQSSYEMTSKGVVFQCATPWHSHFIYTLPQPIVETSSTSDTAKKEDIYSLTFRYKAEPAGNHFTVQFWDISGNKSYVNFASMAENITDNGWTESTVYWHELKYQLDDGTVSDTLRLRSLKNFTVRLNGAGTH